MRKKLLLLALFMLWAMPCFAQQVDTAWVRRYNWPELNEDYANAMAIDGSGNVYVTGYSYSNVTGVDYATIKYYPNGDTAWVRRYNGPGDSTDYANAIAVDGSGNVYVTGYSYGSGTYDDYATIKYSPNGDTAWVRRYNGPGNYKEWTRAMAVDGSCNVYVSGGSYGSETGEDYATIKYLPNGDTAWIRRYSGHPWSMEIASAIAVDGSGYVYVTGRSNWNCATMKYYPNGDTVWVRSYDGGNGDDYGFDIVVDGSKNVYVTGQSFGSGTELDYFTIKYYPNGDTAWVRRYNGSGNGWDYGEAIAVDESGNVYVTGYSMGSGTSYDYATIKYYPNGNTAWVRRYNGPGNNEDYANAMAVDGSGNVYVTGYSYGSGTYHDYATIKYDPFGDELWIQRYNGPGKGYDYAHSIAVDSSNNVYVTGGSWEGWETDWSYTTIKYWQNYPPSAFSLVSPPDVTYITSLPYIANFDWGDAADPDPGDQVRYDLYISRASSFDPDSTTVRDSLLSSQHLDTLNLARFYWKVRAYDNHSGVWSNQTWMALSAIRGDGNGDGKVTVSDVVYCINYLFKGGPAPYPLLNGDVNCDSKVTVADVVYLINYLFKGGPPPAC